MTLRIIGCSMQRAWSKSFRRPVHLTFSLAQPLMWLFFFGLLMERFPSELLPENVGYRNFILPGICAMTVLFGASQAGISLIRDMQTGFLQRVLMTSAPIWAIHLGKVLADCLRLLIQALVVLVVGVSIGIRMQVSWPAAILAFLGLFLFAFAFANISCWIALRTQRQESMAAFVHIVNMPIFFTSTALLPEKQMPAWLANIAVWNPLSLAVDGLRQALLFQTMPSTGQHLVPLLIAATITVFVTLHEMKQAARISSWESK